MSVPIKDGQEPEPQAQCDVCRHIARVSKFLGNEPDDDKCPMCRGKHWTFL